MKKNLINRIKAYKNKEGLGKPSKLNLDIKLNHNHNNNDGSGKRTNNEDIGSFTDEFNDSINYLNMLSKKKKEENKSPVSSSSSYQQDNKHQSAPTHSQNTLYNEQKQQIKSKIERKTIKNYNNIKSTPLPYVQLELPEELREPIISNNYHRDYNISHNTNSELPVFKLNATNDDVPFGCLKNGSKPTYRTWQMTKKNNDRLSIQGQSQKQQPTSQIQTLQFENQIQRQSSPILSEREKRLDMIKQKLKNQQLLLEKERELEKRSNESTSNMGLTDYNEMNKLIEANDLNQENQMNHENQMNQSIQMNQELLLDYNNFMQK